MNSNVNKLSDEFSSQRFEWFVKQRVILINNLTSIILKTFNLSHIVTSPILSTIFTGSQPPQLSLPVVRRLVECRKSFSQGSAKFRVGFRQTPLAPAALAEMSAQLCDCWPDVSWLYTQRIYRHTALSPGHWGAKAGAKICLIQYYTQAGSCGNEFVAKRLSNRTWELRIDFNYVVYVRICWKKRMRNPWRKMIKWRLGYSR